MDQVSEGQGLPIGHDIGIALTWAFVLGRAGNGGWPGHQVDYRDGGDARRGSGSGRQAAATASTMKAASWAGCSLGRLSTGERRGCRRGNAARRMGD